MKWSWPGIVTVILAVGVSAALVLAVFLVARSGVTNPDVLGVLMGAIVGAISTYLGINRDKHDDP
jgi:hypothetical protein